MTIGTSTLPRDLITTSLAVSTNPAWSVERNRIVCSPAGATNGAV